MALTDKLDAIADSIRAKTGKTALMTLDEMPAEIASISGGGSGGGVDESKVFGDAYIILTPNRQISSESYYDIDLSDYITDTSQIVSIFCSSNLSSTITSSYKFAGYWTRYNGKEITNNSSHGYIDGMKNSTFYYIGKGSYTCRWEGLYSGTTLTFYTVGTTHLGTILIRYNTEV